ncbi:hypothetical protein EJ06DRAFT_583986 [Trichodelitschia bisporula]|uniref:Uncharacterized protein n=1 Tax=Trichodelitschia bisporula TaxID=703511 RepID=A0A6G1HR25_9PEZI|nr:hypothetical protein EJ06DRAFT_583986 [Trichodelitschia bisporula]
MTVSVAAPPVSSALAPPDSMSSSRNYALLAPSGSSSGTGLGIVRPTLSTNTSSNSNSNSSSSHSPSSGPESSSHGPLRKPPSEGKRSPNTNRTPTIPKVIVKKEPSSPPATALPTPRHRPRRLDLSAPTMAPAGALSSRPSAPLTSRESAGLMQDVGLACLSPGFSTHDPTMRNQLERSMSVREQQRKIIEARQKGTGGGSKDTDGTSPALFKATRTPGGRRKGPPPGLSIHAPSASQFANERVVQSAPLHQSFTGLRQPAHQRYPPPTAMPHNASQQHAAQNQHQGQDQRHIHHVPATQTTNRLPPITDVFNDLPPSSRRHSPHNTLPAPQHHGHGQHPHTLPSPGFAPVPHTAGYTPASRPREYKSAEEAVHSLTGGREDLLPRLVHYGGHQPPTPPSPGGMAGSRRRDREEYEGDVRTPPLGRGPAQAKARREGGESEAERAKREEFIMLCGRLWDLFHAPAA